MELNHREKELIDIFRNANGSNVTLVSLSKEIGLSQSTISHICRGLEFKGYIKKINNGRFGSTIKVIQDKIDSDVQLDNLLSKIVTKIPKKNKQNLYKNLRRKYKLNSFPRLD